VLRILRYTLPVALLTGILLFIGLPGGGNFWPLLFVALAPFFYLIQQVERKEALAVAFLAGLSHFLLLLYWITIVLGKYGGLPLVVALLGLVLLAVYMGSYFVLFTLLARMVLHRGGAFISLLVLPALWVGLDWLRSVLFTGLPWMDLGYGLFRVLPLVQLADLVGHAGLTYLIVLVNLAVALLVKRNVPGLQRGIVLVVTVGILAGAVLYGQQRLAQLAAVENGPESRKVMIGIAQGNIDQARKWSPAMQQTTLDIYRKLTIAILPGEKPELVVWPETALPFYPTNNDLILQVNRLAVDNDTALLTGAPWFEIVDRKARKVKFFNSSLLLGTDGEIHGQYFKSHLVPFGEYVPLKRFLPFLAPLVEAVGDFTPGTIAKPLGWGQMQLGVLICFESVFPDLARTWVENGANILVNLTNDAWYGKSSAPYHSLAMAVLRAVENRRSMVRSANTGISAFIAPGGRIISESSIFTEWSAKAKLVLMNEKTWFVRGGYWFGPGCLLAGIMVSVICGMFRRQRAMRWQKQSPK